MSHHDSPEVQAQVIARVSLMFRTIIAEEGEDMKVDPAIADTLVFVREEGCVSEYAFEHDDQLYLVELTEEQVDGILHEEETHLDYLDSVVYGVLCDLEDGIVFGDEDSE